MPFRFSKRISLGKGLRLNLSKGGFSWTLGGRGLSLNVGKRGIRPTVSLPGTGISYTPSSSRGRKKTSVESVNSSSPDELLLNDYISTSQIDTPSADRRSVNKKPVLSFIQLSVLGVLSLMVCCLCGLVFAFFDYGQPVLTVPTAEAQIPIEQIIILTSNAAQTQTQASFTHTPVSSSQQIGTLTFTSTVTFLPTDMISDYQTLVAQTPFEYVNTPVPPIIILPPPQGSSGENANGCSCSSDTYNCSDFGSQQSAQSCFNTCASQGYGDIHRLDADGNNVACESLP